MVYHSACAMMRSHFRFSHSLHFQHINPHSLKTATQLELCATMKLPHILLFGVYILSLLFLLLFPVALRQFNTTTNELQKRVTKLLVQARICYGLWTFFLCLCGNVATNSCSFFACFSFLGQTASCMRLEKDVDYEYYREESIDIQFYSEYCTARSTSPPRSKRPSPFSGAKSCSG